MSTSLPDEDVKAKINNVETEIKEVKVKINKVEGKIDKVEEEIKEVKDSIKATTSDKEKEELREEKLQLGKRLLQLGDEKNKLLGMLAALTQPPQGEPQSGKKRKAAELDSVCFPATTTSEKVIVITKEVKLRPFGHFVPQGRIFQRECYEPLMQKVFDGFKETKRVMITGTPGVGKSLFGLLFLRELIRRLKARRDGDLTEEWLKDLGGRIVYEHTTGIQPNSFTDYYEIDTRSGVVWALNDWPHAQRESDIFLIRDGPCGKTAFDGYVFWASSPRPDDFQKSNDFDRKLFYMPPWTEQELIECWQNGCAPASLFDRFNAQARHDILHKDVIAALEVLIDFRQLDLAVYHDLHQNKVGPTILTCLADVLKQPEYQKLVLRRWIADLGPVARRVFDPQRGYKRLFSALTLDREHMKLTQLIEFLQSDDYHNDTAKFNHAHALLIMHTTSEYANFFFTPSSPSVGTKILSTMLRDELLKARQLMGQIQGTNKGLVFEPLAHHVLCTSTNVFEAYSLIEPRKKIEVKLCGLEECKVTDEKLCGSDEFKIEDTKYYTPTNESFPVVDAWTSHYMFQMTVSSLTDEHGHPIKSASKLFLELRNRYKGINPKLIFVVPKSEEAKLNQMKPQTLVCTDGKKPATNDGPHGGWNNLEQFVLFL